MNLLFLNYLQRLSVLVLILPLPWQVLNATEAGSSLERASCHNLGTVPANETLKPIMSLSIMRCFASNKEADKASLFAWEVLNDPFWNSEVLALREALENLIDREKDAVDALLSPGVQILEEPPHISDRKRREALTLLLEFLMQHGSKQEASLAHQKIFLSLGDTEHGKRILKAKPFKGSIEQQAQRIDNLASRHENKLVLKEGPKALSQAPLDQWTCRIAYQLGKSGRKKRRYAVAHRYLDRVLKECTGTTVRKALYMKAKVASFQKLGTALTIYNRFLAEHTQDSLADDVMMMKALHLENNKKTTEAITTYQQLLKQYPTGDQWNVAAFRLAFALARSEDTQAAIDQLDALARKDDLDSFTQDRALYWRGRLKIYPQLQKLNVTQSHEQKAIGKKELLVLSQNRIASYYGHLALRLLHHGTAQEHFDDTALLPPSFPSHNLEQTALPQQLDRDTEELHIVQELLDHGFEAEAIWVLDRLAVDGTIPLYDKALGYFLAGAYGKSHRTLRRGHLHWPHGKPVAENFNTWRLVFPKAYASAFKNAALTHELPQSMLWGLSREESAFEKDVTSWAGARGLCQLMPATAKEEAQIGKMTLRDLNQLFEPQTNTLLGAQHLKRRMKLLKHPFLAIAAYNAGPGNVRKWRKRLKDYEAMDAFVEAIPVNQTRNYVRKVVGSWITYAFFTAEQAETDFSLILPPSK